jgi:GTP-binding protein EngB required for normal cell division
MPNLDPWKNKYENDLFRTTVEQEKKANRKFENYLLSYRDECQNTIERNSHQHPTYLERYQKIIEMIDWTLKRYRIVINKRDKIQIQQQQQNEQDLVIINRIREELEEKRKIAINKNKQSELIDEIAMYRLEETSIDYVLSEIREFVYNSR